MRDPLLLTVLALVIGWLLAYGMVFVFRKIVPEKQAKERNDEPAA